MASLFSYNRHIWGALILCACLLTPSWAFNVYQLGGRDGNAWSAPLSKQPGTYAVLRANGQVLERLEIRAAAKQATWSDTLTVSIDTLGGQWLRPFWVPDTLNLAQDGVRQRVSGSYHDNLGVSDNCGLFTSVLNNIRLMLDGDPTTAAFFRVENIDDVELRQQNFRQNIVIDMGANYPINRVRFFPRLGQDHDLIDEILAEMEQPKLRQQDLLKEDFTANVLPWYEVTGAASEHQIQGGCTSFEEFRLQSIGSFRRAPNDPRLTVLKRDDDNIAPVVDIRFPPQALQWITIRPLDPVANWEIAEFQVFGHGYVPRAVYTSAVLDMSEPMIFGKVRWQGDKGENAEIQLRTRSGTTPDPNLYWRPSTIPGQSVQIGFAEYDRLRDPDRSTTLDRAHWSAWSAPHEWTDGLRTSRTPPHLWEDGVAMLAPGPARFFQFSIEFSSTMEDAPRLEQLEFQFSRPVATEVVAEIWPLDVDRTAPTTFTYTVLPVLTEDNPGFDRLEIFTLTRAQAVHSVEVDELDISRQYPPQILDDRIVVTFPRLQGANDSEKLIKVVFDTQVVFYGTEFRSWIFDSRSNGVKQLIAPGDADPDSPGDGLSVRTEFKEGLFADLAVFPNPFTPNGDGINDRVRFAFQLHGVTAPRGVSVQIYDMAGQLVRDLGVREVVRGVFETETDAPVWDGLDGRGQNVPPGIYVYKMILNADRGKEKHLGTIAVVY